MATDALTKDIHSKNFYWPNRIGRTYLLALEDVLGRNRINAIFDGAGLRTRIANYPPDNLDLGWSFVEMSTLGQSIDDTYGRQGGSGIASRSGRAWFHHARKDFGAVLGIGDVAFRLLPLRIRIKMSLSAMADTFNKASDQVVRVEEKGERFFYHIDRCPECWNRTSVEPICNAELGLLEESLRHVTGGMSLFVEEILCVAQGDPSCTYLIEKRYRE